MPAGRKHVPQRSCVVCRTTDAKRSLVRLVRRPDGITIDPTGKLNGRGAYLCGRAACWEKAARSDLLGAALRIRLSPADREMLEAQARERAAQPQDE